MAEIHFTVPLIPTAKGRPRFFRAGKFARAFTPAKTARAEENFVALAASHAPPSPLEGPLSVELQFMLPIPASWSKKKQEAAANGLMKHTKKPDVDNLEKLVLDALTRSGQWWRDDAQIVSLAACKVYNQQPRTEVTITYMEDTHP